MTTINRRLLLIALVLAAVLSACSTDGDDVETGTTAESTSEVESATPDEPSGTEETTRLWIAPELVDCVGVAPQQCMLVTTSEDGEAEFFYDAIDGFTYTEGTSYVIDVTIDEIEDPPADASSLRYTLVQIVEETPAS